MVDLDCGKIREISMLESTSPPVAVTWLSHTNIATICYTKEINLCELKDARLELLKSISLKQLFPTEVRLLSFYSNIFFFLENVKIFFAYRPRFHSVWQRLADF